MKVLNSLVLRLSALVLVSSTALAVPRIPLSAADYQKGLELMKQTPLAKPVEVEYQPDSGNCLRAFLSFRIMDESTKVETLVKVKYMRPQGRGPFPVVLVIPTIAGETFVEPLAAANLCHAGIASVIADINGQQEPSVYPGWENLDARFRFAVQSARNIVDYLSWKPEIDKSKIGIMGSSLGGITAALISAVEPRIKASVIIAGGGNLPEIGAYSMQPEVVKVREQRMSMLSLSSQQVYELEMRKHSLLDPIFFVRKDMRDQVLQVVVVDDVRVPAMTQQELWEAFGKPTRWVYNGGHIPSIVSFAFFNSSEPVNFFKTRFGLK